MTSRLPGGKVVFHVERLGGLEVFHVEQSFFENKRFTNWVQRSWRGFAKTGRHYLAGNGLLDALNLGSFQRWSQPGSLVNGCPGPAPAPTR